MTTPDEIRHKLMDLAQQRGFSKTICPSEVARHLGGEIWRVLMPTVRGVGTQLVDEGKIVTLQKGNLVDPRQAK